MDDERLKGIGSDKHCQFCKVCLRQGGVSSAKQRITGEMEIDFLYHYRLCWNCNPNDDRPNKNLTSMSKWVLDKDVDAPIANDTMSGSSGDETLTPNTCYPPIKGNVSNL